ncbi:MAG: chaperone NapD [Gammaproteobacteria bacterium]|nr:chaperone NapD [Gammaproteobacteria bacterium]
MTICSLVLQAIPENLPPVIKKLEEMDGVEVHATNEAGKMVVSIDHPSRKYCSDVMTKMTLLDGVMSTSLVYEYQEDLDFEVNTKEIGNEETTHIIGAH